MNHNEGPMFNLPESEALRHNRHLLIKQLLQTVKELSDSPKGPADAELSETQWQQKLLVHKLNNESKPQKQLDLLFRGKLPKKGDKGEKGEPGASTIEAQEAAEIAKESSQSTEILRNDAQSMAIKVDQNMVSSQSARDEARGFAQSAEQSVKEVLEAAKQVKIDADKAKAILDEIKKTQEKNEKPTPSPETPNSLDMSPEAQMTRYNTAMLNKREITQSEKAQTEAKKEISEAKQEKNSTASKTFELWEEQMIETEVLNPNRGDLLKKMEREGQLESGHGDLLARMKREGMLKDWGFVATPEKPVEKVKPTEKPAEIEQPDQSEDKAEPKLVMPEGKPWAVKPENKDQDKKSTEKVVEPVKPTAADEEKARQKRLNEEKKQRDAIKVATEIAKEQGRKEIWKLIDEKRANKNIFKKAKILFKHHSKNPETDEEKVDKYLRDIYRTYVFAGLGGAGLTTLIWGGLNHAGIIAPWFSWLLGDKSFPVFPNHSQIIHK